MIVQRKVTVEWQVDGFHRWPDATGERAYLADRHRHRFHCAVTIPVEHSNRDVEFHDLLDLARGVFRPDSQTLEFGAMSCEALAERLATFIGQELDLPWVEACVSEDGYVSGSVRWEYP